MRTSEVVSSETIHSIMPLTVVTNPEKITLKCGLYGVWKPESKDGPYGSYKSELGAYEVDRLFSLKMFPLTVKRKINGEEGSLQLWVPNMSKTCYSLSDDAKFFRLLIGHYDIGNVAGVLSHNYGFIGSGHDRRAVLFDAAGAFRRSKRFFSLYESASSLKPTQSFLDTARQLNRDQLESIESLTRMKKEDMLTRRNVLIGVIDKDHHAIAQGLKELSTAAVEEVEPAYTPFHQ